MAGEIKELDLSFDSFENFYQSLQGTELIGTILYKNVIDMLESLNKQLFINEGEKIKMFFALFFVLFENGNICIPLKSEQLRSAINKLLSAPFSKKTSQEIDTILDSGIKFVETVANKSSQRLIQKVEYGENFNQECPFVLYSRDGKIDFLYSSKYFRAKLDIEKRIKSLFGQKASSNTFKDTSAEDYSNSEIKKITKKVFPLNNEQFEAVRRGANGESLFITGGAGTGKTTAVFYLLKELIEKNNIGENDIFLVAPSGKAADRLTESIIKSLDNIIDEKRSKTPFTVIENLKGSTIHSLLHYSPRENAFEYSRLNPIGDENSIFVIDEASMIDVLIFADLLNAIHDGAKVYILGDPNQLPSVGAGAVLGSLLDIKSDSNFTVHLVKSNRFSDESVVSNLAKSIIEEKGYSFEEFITQNSGMWKSLEEFKNFVDNDKKDNGKKFPVFCYDLNSQEQNYTAKQANLSSILKDYFNYFYNSKLYSNKKDVSKITYNLVDLKSKSDDRIKDIEGRLKELFDIQECSRILTANRLTDIGCENINRVLTKEARVNYNKLYQNDASERVSVSEIFFPGVLAIITKNIKNLNLFNGDNGIIVRVRDSDRTVDCLVVKKPIESKTYDFDFAQISRYGDYMFYPLSLIPSDSIELAFAITIHKSQGSGYNNILVFLPEDKDSPLLNRQILYTAITRTQGNTYIVSSVKNFIAAQQNKIERYTEIEI